MDAVMIGILIAIVVAAVAVGAMKAQMRPVARKQEASQYVTAQDVTFSVRDDVYLRTDVVRRPIQTMQTQGGGPGHRPGR